jgi:hypothetical protein
MHQKPDYTIRHVLLVKYSLSNDKSTSVSIGRSNIGQTLSGRILGYGIPRTTLQIA